MDRNHAPDAARFFEDSSDDLMDERQESDAASIELPDSTGPAFLSAQSWTIRELSSEFGVSPRTLRFYEERGLLRPRRVGTARYFDARDRLHLKMILKGKQLGFTLSEIRDILARRDESAFADPSPAWTMDATPHETAPSSNGPQHHRASVFADTGRPHSGHSSNDAVIDPASIDLAKLDFAMGLTPDQIAAQIEHLERQRQQIGEAIAALHDAYRRRCPA
jgi:DNA-binding transcriptional MerR regulator